MTVYRRIDVIRIVYLLKLQAYNHYQVSKLELKVSFYLYFKNIYVKK
jgi:hypothetical protein